MKRLRFTVRRVAFRCALSCRPGIQQFQAGIVRGHYVLREKSYFTGEYRWNRYYSIEVRSGPSSLIGTRVECFAEWVFRWPHVEQSSCQ